MTAERRDRQDEQGRWRHLPTNRSGHEPPLGWLGYVCDALLMIRILDSAKFILLKALIFDPDLRQPAQGAIWKGRPDSEERGRKEEAERRAVAVHVRATSWPKGQENIRERALRARRKHAAQG
jgi:hypothetical protein